MGRKVAGGPHHPLILVGQQAFVKYFKQRHLDVSSVSMAADNDITHNNIFFVP